ncbi:MAG: hypothetical protein M1823_003843 [Watsoniomyces obsoletus]|nr:MAG: hypothetical protein M1823_003843 [Watsoniomyces obsoletus]
MAILQAIGTVNSDGQRAFYALSTIVIIGLSLTVFKTLRSMAKLMRGRILSSNDLDARQVDLILGGNSLTNIFRLIFHRGTKRSIRVVAFAWLLLNTAAQVAVGVLSIFSQLERGVDSNGIRIVRGDVTVPNLDCFYQAGSNHCSPHQDQYDPAIAHTYGGTGILRGEDCGYNGTLDDIGSRRQSCSYFYQNNTHESADRKFAYRYADWNPDDGSRVYPYLGTGRIITASASKCNMLNVTGIPLNTTSDPDGRDNVFVWPFANATVNTTIDIPKPALARSSTTYIWNDEALPRDAVAQACGPRCVFVYAVRDMLDPSDGRHGLALFQCQITVDPVRNPTHPMHNLSDSVARTAAASIALTGRWRSGGDGRDWRQYQLYQEGADWATKFNDTPAMVGARMAEFAIAGLGVMARRNPKEIIPGCRPTLGYQVQNDWKGFYVDALVIFIVQLALTVWVISFARPIILDDDSYLVIAHLLRGLMAPLPSRVREDEDPLDGEKIAAEIEARMSSATDETVVKPTAGQSDIELTTLATDSLSRPSHNSVGEVIAPSTYLEPGSSSHSSVGKVIARSTHSEPGP